MTPLVFLDCETTGVHPDRRVWEVAMIRRDDVGERELVIQIGNVDLSNADPFGLKIGGFYERAAKYGRVPEGTRVMSEVAAAKYVEEWTRGAHLVGAVPNFDADCLDKMLRRHLLIPAWHYHLVDVEAMAVGWLNAKASHFNKQIGSEVEDPITLPWKSEALSVACGVAVPTEEERHTALGDARWAMRWYDTMMS